MLLFFGGTLWEYTFSVIQLHKRSVNSILKKVYIYLVFVLSIAAILLQDWKQKKLVNQLHCVSCMLHKCVTDVLLSLSDSARMA